MHYSRNKDFQNRRSGLQYSENQVHFSCEVWFRRQCILTKLHQNWFRSHQNGWQSLHTKIRIKTQRQKNNEWQWRYRCCQLFLCADYPQHYNRWKMEFHWKQFRNAFRTLTQNFHALASQPHRRGNIPKNSMVEKHQTVQQQNYRTQAANGKLDIFRGSDCNRSFSPHSVESSSQLWGRSFVAKAMG